MKLQLVKGRELSEFKTGGIRNKLSHENARASL
jgi:hypothetical protein